MNRVAKKGAKLLEQLKSTVPMTKLDGMKDFYLRKQNTPFAIRNVQAFHITGTDAVLVLGGLDLAMKTAHVNEHQRQKCTEECHQHEEPAAAEEAAPEPVDEAVDEEKQAEMEKAIAVVMEQGGVTREEAEKALKENDNDPLACLIAMGK